MGWAVGFDSNHDRDVGYGVPAVCDHPECNERINRGLSYVCGNDVYGGERGCGLFFCSEHRSGDGLCECCEKGVDHFQLKPDVSDWIDWKLTDESWAQWRSENPEKVLAMQSRLNSESEYIEIPAFLRRGDD